MKPKLLFLVTEDWYFCSHRLALAKAALAAGFDVAVATHVSRHEEMIKSAGVRLIPVKMRRSVRSSLAELYSIWDLIRLYQRENPGIVWFHRGVADPCSIPDTGHNRIRFCLLFFNDKGASAAFSGSCRVAVGSGR